LATADDALTQKMQAYKDDLKKKVEESAAEMSFQFTRKNC
jgi:5-(carboxyamino)imidazole ribonucleotide mutase